jgi:hypothetical protein
VGRSTAITKPLENGQVPRNTPIPWLARRCKYQKEPTQREYPLIWQVLSAENLSTVVFGACPRRGGVLQKHLVRKIWRSLAIRVCSVIQHAVVVITYRSAWRILKWILGSHG